MTAPATDPVFVLAAAIHEALVEVTVAVDHLEWASHRGISAQGAGACRSAALAQLRGVQRRLRAAEEIGLDVQVTTAPVEGQEVLW